MVGLYNLTHDVSFLKIFFFYVGGNPPPKNNLMGFFFSVPHVVSRPSHWGMFGVFWCMHETLIGNKMHHHASLFRRFTWTICASTTADRTPLFVCFVFFDDTGSYLFPFLRMVRNLWYSNHHYDEIQHTLLETKLKKKKKATTTEITFNEHRKKKKD